MPEHQDPLLEERQEGESQHSLPDQDSLLKLLGVAYTQGRYQGCVHRLPTSSADEGLMTRIGRDDQSIMVWRGRVTATEQV